MREGQNLEYAKKLRGNLTEAEKRLWYHLRAHRFCGLKFKRQYPLGPFIIDFICIEYQLAVELDGGQHATQGNYDAVRDKFLKEHGFTTLRFWNNDVLTNTEAVLDMIARYCNVTSPLPNPLPQAGEGTVSIAHG